MTESNLISGQIPAPSVAPALIPTQNQGYQKAGEVRGRAAASQSPDTDEIQRGLLRLNQILDTNQPLNTDVPRGFYLNIQV